jgi:hypothetical protein
VFIDPKEILSILDQCCENYSFPMLDNGYFYLAGTRLSLYRSTEDWAMVFELFGFSPRTGYPEAPIITFANRIHNRTREKYVTQVSHETYIANHPHNDWHSRYPIAEGLWQDEENDAFVAQEAYEVVIREQSITLPSIDIYEKLGIVLEESPRVQVFELCRYLETIAREQILATSQERRVNVLPEMELILVLNEWNHPDVIQDSERPSGSETFRQLAQVLATGDVIHYRPTQAPNTHWRNWPDGGRL